MLTRRQLIATSVAAPIATSLPAAAAASAPRFPDKSAFHPTDLTYLDSGSQHPINLGARQAMEAYLARRTLDPLARNHHLDGSGVRAKFARLINAEPDEISFVQSTTAGEQLVLNALGLPSAGAHVVTDTLHFSGSIPIYLEMAKRGVEVTWLRDRDGRIDIRQVRDAIRPGTRLVSLSAVSTYNGFQHDLKAVCDAAHEKGALVYADIIHAAGAVPLDVKASGVDFAACATYKWLMGEFGLGFLYVAKSRLADLQRPVAGYYGLSDFRTHIYPLDPPGDTIADYAFAPTTSGMFMQGTHAHTVIAALQHSLDYIHTLGVANIQAHAQSLTDQLKRELPKRGYRLLTPVEAKTPIVTFQQKDAGKVLGPLLDAAKIRITLSGNRGRVTPSVFNDGADIDRLLSVLPRANA